MAETRRAVLELLAYAAFAAALGLLSSAPRYSPLEPAKAQLRLSFSHSGERVVPCRRYTPEEIARMAPNMRRALDCVRERVPLVVDLELDGKPLFHAVLPPAGLARDGASTAYHGFALDAGPHRLTARLRDSRREAGYDHEQRFELELEPGENRVLDFRAEEGGFRLLATETGR